MATTPRKPLLGALLAALLAIAIGVFHVGQRYSLPGWLVGLLPRPCIGLMPLLSPPPWGWTFDDLAKLDLRGQTAVVTGANSGIGFEISRHLSRRGAAVYMACRNMQRCFAAADKIKAEEGYSGAVVRPMLMDVSQLKSVQFSAKAIEQQDVTIDMLFLNAGIVAHNDPDHDDANTLPTSKDGIEMVFATNVVGHHLLYRLLEPLLQKSDIARVVSTSSLASMWWLPPYASPWRFGDTSPLIPSTLDKLNEGNPSSTLNMLSVYGRSKLGQVAWTKALTRRLGANSSIYVNAAHPGAVFTKLAQDKSIAPGIPHVLFDLVVWIEERLLWTSEEGALTELFLGTATDEIRSKDLRGRYFHPQAIELGHPIAEDEALQESVWDLCEELAKSYL